MSFANDDKERVKQATDIVDLVGSFLPLQRRGNVYKALCPWHRDNSPSLDVNPAKQIWKCWVCDIGGDCFSFIERHENVGFRESLEMLAERAGIELTNRPQARTVAGNPNDKPTLFRAMNWAARQYHQCLLNDPAAEPARRYLAARGITEAAIERFVVGFAPNSWSWLSDRAKSTEFSSLVLNACGLANKSDRGSYYDFFRGRVMFPIHDTQDRAIAFGGRILPEIAEQEEQDNGRAPAKYFNSNETKLYSKSDNLFALNVAKKSLASERHLIIVEGYTDVIGAWIAGVENVSAVCGTALNQRHIRLIKRFADKITLVLDGDEAGQRRTNEILEHFIQANVDLRILTLPEGMDPCDFVQVNGAGPFRDLIAGARDALEHKIVIETQGVDLIRDTHNANRALDNILRTIASGPTSISTTADGRLKIQQILTRISSKFQVELGWITARVAELRKERKTTRYPGEDDSSPKRESKPLVPLESELLEILMRSQDLIDPIVENISPDQFVPGPCREIYEHVCHCYHEGAEITFDSMMLQLEDTELKNLLVQLEEKSVAKASLTEVDLSDQLNELIIKFDRMTQDQNRRQAITELNQSELDQSEESRILEQLFQQAKERQGIQ